MRDDLIGLILGCGCRKRCCCGEPEARAPEPQGGNLFQQAGRGTPPLHVPEDSPFIPMIQSFDSPQRPGHWGQPHLPGVDPDGTFTGTGGSVGEAVAVLDDGSLLPVSSVVVDHAARTLSFPRIVSQVNDDPDTTAIECSKLSSDVLNSDGDLAGDPRYRPVGWTVQSGTWGQTTYQTRLYHYAGGFTDLDDAQAIATSGSVRYGRLMTGGVVLDPYRLIEFWDQWGEVDPRRPLLTLWRRYRRVQGYGEVIGGSPDWGTITATVQERTLGDWERDGVTPYYPEVRTVQTSSQLYWVISSAPTAPPPPPGQRWASPDGQVTVFGPYTDDHADLTDSELTAYGHTFAGGSWAALCGPVVTPEGQTGGHPEPWILHELGNVITRITPDGEAQTMNRADFEAQTLRLNDRAFLRFNPVGTLFNTWPPQWAFAECGRGDTLEQVRAVALHDPWRDSVKGRPPEDSPLPPWWYWPARPRRHPPAAVSSAPLGLALADVLDAAGGTDPGGSS